MNPPCDDGLAQKLLTNWTVIAWCYALPDGFVRGHVIFVSTDPLHTLPAVL